MNRLHTCCFTGHRDIPPEILPALAAKLEAIVLERIADGIKYFYAGGALGFSTHWPPKPYCDCATSFRKSSLFWRCPAASKPADGLPRQSADMNTSCTARTK